MPKTKTKNFEVTYYRESDVTKRAKSGKDIPLHHLTVAAKDLHDAYLSATKIGRRLISVVPRTRGHQKPKPTVISMYATANLLFGSQAHETVLPPGRDPRAKANKALGGFALREQATDGESLNVAEVFNVPDTDPTPLAEVVALAEALQPDPSIEVATPEIVDPDEQEESLAEAAEVVAATTDVTVLVPDEETEAAGSLDNSDLNALLAKATDEVSLEKAAKDKDLLAKVNTSIAHREKHLAYLVREASFFDVTERLIADQISSLTSTVNELQERALVRHDAKEILAKDHPNDAPEFEALPAEDRTRISGLHDALRYLTYREERIDKWRTDAEASREDTEVELDTLKAFRAELTGEPVECLCDECAAEDDDETSTQNDFTFGRKIYIYFLVAAFVTFAGVLAGGQTTQYVSLGLVIGLVVSAMGLALEIHRRT